MVKIWTPILIAAALIIAVLGIGVYFISQQMGCTSAQTQKPSEYANKEVQLFQPLISFSYQKTPEKFYLTDMDSKNSTGGHASYKLLPIPNVFQVIDHIENITESCERTIWARLRDEAGKIHLMEITKLQSYFNGKRPALSKFFTTNIEPNYEHGVASTHPFTIRFKAPSTEVEKNMDPETLLHSRLGEVKLNFETLGFDFVVSKTNPSYGSATMLLTMESATYLSQSTDFFNITKMTTLAN